MTKVQRLERENAELRDNLSRAQTQYAHLEGYYRRANAAAESLIQGRGDVHGAGRLGAAFDLRFEVTRGTRKGERTASWPFYRRRTIKRESPNGSSPGGSREKNDVIRDGTGVPSATDPATASTNEKD